eukprot:scaffold33581_cov62-Phaeocystis_antarctica.AAC.2
MAGVGGDDGLGRRAQLGAWGEGQSIAVLKLERAQGAQVRDSGWQLRQPRAAAEQKLSEGLQLCAISFGSMVIRTHPLTLSEMRAFSLPTVTGSAVSCTHWSKLSEARACSSPISSGSTVRAEQPPRLSVTSACSCPIVVGSSLSCTHPPRLSVTSACSCPIVVGSSLSREQPLSLSSSRAPSSPISAGSTISSALPAKLRLITRPCSLHPTPFHARGSSPSPQCFCSASLAARRRCIDATSVVDVAIRDRPGPEGFRARVRGFDPDEANESRARASEVRREYVGVWWGEDGTCLRVHCCSFTCDATDRRGGNVANMLSLRELRSKSDGTITLRQTCAGTVCVIKALSYSHPQGGYSHPWPACTHEARRSWQRWACLCQSACVVAQLEEELLVVGVVRQHPQRARRRLLAHRAPLAQQRHQRRQRALHLGDGHLVVGVVCQVPQRARRILLAHRAPVAQQRHQRRKRALLFGDDHLVVGVDRQVAQRARRPLLAHRAPLAQQRHQRRQRALLLGDDHLVVGVDRQAPQRARRMLLGHRAPVAQQRHQRRQRALHLGDGHLVVGVDRQVPQRARRMLLAPCASVAQQRHQRRQRALLLGDGHLVVGVDRQAPQRARRMLLGHRAPVAQQRHQRRQRALLLGDGHLVVGVGRQVPQRDRRLLLGIVAARLQLGHQRGHLRQLASYVLGEQQHAAHAARLPLLLLLLEELVCLLVRHVQLRPAGVALQRLGEHAVGGANGDGGPSRLHLIAAHLALVLRERGEVKLLPEHGVHLLAHALKERLHLATEGAHLARPHEHREDKLHAKFERTP